MSKLDELLLPVFARQHWVASLGDVRAAGGDHRAASRRVGSGTWERVGPATYRLVGAPQPWEASVLAPILSMGPGAVASHTTAATLHGIPGFAKGTPEITVARVGGDRRRVRAIVHTSTDLDRCGKPVIRGIPVTDLERTFLDLARRTGHQRLTRAIEAARRDDATSWDQLIHTLVRHARRGRPGVRRLRGVILANMHRHEVTDSDLELLVLAAIRTAGLPEPVLHHKVFDGDRFVAEIDLGYPHLKIAIELDGRIHLEEDVWQRDLPRQNDLVLLGWTVLRFTWDRFRQRPDAVIAEIAAAIRAAAAS